MKHESTEIIGDLLQLNITRPARAHLPSRVVIGRNPRRQMTFFLNCQRSPSGEKSTTHTVSSDRQRLLTA